MTRLVLASESATRRRLLTAAGLDITVDPAALDEAAVKRGFVAEGRAAEDCAAALAESKAVAVSRRHREALVIGADQILDCAGIWFDKPRDPDEARRQLRALRGRTHALVSAVALAQDGVVRWRHAERAQLAMRAFSDAFLDRYVAAMGDAICATVGGYELEGRGAQLFERIDGDYFAILGLPLLPLLERLRREGVIAA